MSDRLNDATIARLASGVDSLETRMALEIKERRAEDLDNDDLRSIADTVDELRANAQDWDPGVAEDAIRPLLKILRTHGASK
jgi:hypothetical protein